MLHSKYFGRAIAAVALAGVAILGACNQDTLLVAPTPDVVKPSDISGPAALPAAYAAAIGDFQIGYAGGYGTGLDNNEGLAQMSGLLADELVDAETFNTRIEVDRRATKPINQHDAADLPGHSARARHHRSRREPVSPVRSDESAGPRDSGVGRVHVRHDRRVVLQRRPDEQGERRRHVQLRRAPDRPAAAHRGGREVRFGDHVGDGERWLDGAQPGPHRQGTRAARLEPGGAGRDRGRAGAVDVQLQHPARREHRAAEQRALRLQLPRRPVRRRRRGGHERPSRSCHSAIRACRSSTPARASTARRSCSSRRSTATAARRRRSRWAPRRV